MDLQRLHTFKTVATLMNFNRAADVLNTSQSTISARIKTLEDEIGVLLFQRIGKSVRLTAAGEKMLIYAEKLLAIGDEAMAEVAGKNGGSGLLTIRMPQTIATLFLPSMLTDFSSCFPETRLDITSCALYSLENELRIGTVDLAFLFADTISVENLEAELLSVEPMVMVTHPNNMLGNYKVVDFKDLEGQIILLPKSDCGYRMIFEQTLIEEKVTPASFIEMNNIEALKRTIIAGMGVTLIPKIAVQAELDQHQMIMLPWEDQLETGVLMIHYRDKWRSPAVETFMAAARHHISSK